jgi:hypothetical protein
MVSSDITAHMQRHWDSVRLADDRRSITARWVLRVNDDGTEEIAALCAMHSRGREYRATLNRTQRENGGGFDLETSAPMSAVVVRDEQTTARFSQNNLEAFLHRALADIRDPANRDRYACKFDPNIPA